MQGIPSEPIATIQSLREGDHIKYHKVGILYAHHAIVCNVEWNTDYYTIINFDGDCGKNGIDVSIRKERKHFIPCEFHVLDYSNSNRLPMEATLAVANFFLKEGFGDYDPVRNNCEHFASICACGKAISFQELRYVSIIPWEPFPTRRKIVSVQQIFDKYNIQLCYEDIFYNW